MRQHVNSVLHKVRHKLYIDSEMGKQDADFQCQLQGQFSRSSNIVRQNSSQGVLASSVEIFKKTRI